MAKSQKKPKSDKIESDPGARERFEGAVDAAVTADNTALHGPLSAIQASLSAGAKRNAIGVVGPTDD